MQRRQAGKCLLGLVPTCCLGPVQRGVGASDQAVGRLVGACHRVADAQRDPGLHRRGVRHAQGVDCSANAPRQFGGLRAVAVGRDDGEFFAAVARHMVACALGGALHRLRHGRPTMPPRRGFGAPETVAAVVHCAGALCFTCAGMPAVRVRAPMPMRAMASARARHAPQSAGRRRALAGCHLVGILRPRPAATGAPTTAPPDRTP